MPPKTISKKNIPHEHTIWTICEFFIYYIFFIEMNCGLLTKLCPTLRKSAPISQCEPSDWVSDTAKGAYDAMHSYPTISNNKTVFQLSSEMHKRFKI